MGGTVVLATRISGSEVGTVTDAEGTSGNDDVTKRLPVGANLAMLAAFGELNYFSPICH